MIWDAERPLVYAGGGIISSDASPELRELVELVDIPTVCTLMGLGALPGSHPNYVSMPGMHGSYAANMGMTATFLPKPVSGVNGSGSATCEASAMAPLAPRDLSLPFGEAPLV